MITFPVLYLWIHHSDLSTYIWVIHLLSGSFILHLLMGLCWDEVKKLLGLIPTVPSINNQHCCIPIIIPKIYNWLVHPLKGNWNKGKVIRKFNLFAKWSEVEQGVQYKKYYNNNKKIHKIWMQIEYLNFATFLLLIPKTLWYVISGLPKTRVPHKKPK